MCDDDDDDDLRLMRETFEKDSTGSKLMPLTSCIHLLLCIYMYTNVSLTDLDTADKLNKLETGTKYFPWSRSPLQITLRKLMRSNSLKMSAASRSFSSSTTVKSKTPLEKYHVDTVTGTCPWTILKTRDTLGNCQRPVFSLSVPQHMHTITSLWKFELNWLSKLQDNN